MIRIEQLSLTVGAFALKDLSLHVAAGEYFVLLGPTGAGKTLLLECICGLKRCDSGRIVIDGADLTRLPPRARRLGYLPQDYALFPQQTVRQNIRFGLRYHGLRQASIDGRVDQLMDQLGVAHLAGRLPGRLSGGEKQRVALARALAIQPRLLLLDEPVSALDESTRDTLCPLLKDLHRQLHTTTIHVCHNFVEMLSVADRVGVIHGGRILQVDAPREVLEHPSSAQVARFVQPGNLLPARAERGGEWLHLRCAGGVELRARDRNGDDPGREVQVMVRAENVGLAAAPPESVPPGDTVLAGRLEAAADLGPLVNATVVCGGELKLRVSLGRRQYAQLGLHPGDSLYAIIPADAVHVLTGE